MAQRMNAAGEHGTQRKPHEALRSHPGCGTRARSVGSTLQRGARCRTPSAPRNDHQARSAIACGLQRFEARRRHCMGLL
jgi:hypothetical protein